MSPRLKKTLAQIGSFILAGGLLYLALRGVDFEEVGSALRQANYLWLLPLAGVTLFSHLIRAWRWQILLEALPTPDGVARKVSLKIAFYSLMIGYMTNYAAPRLGEVIRTANLASREKLRFSSVLGTVVVERILDVVTLFLALTSVLLLFFDRFAIINDLFFVPIMEQLGRIPGFLLLGVGVTVALLVVLIYRRFILTDPSGNDNGFAQRVNSALVAFKEGMMTLVHTRRPLAIVGSSLAIWFCYLLMAHIPFLILGMEMTYDLSLLDSWAIMNLGAVGVAIPSPGGFGSYHYITIQTLVHLFGVDASPAASYAILTHTGQLILYVAVGFLCLVIQGSSLSTLKEQATAGDEAPSPTTDGEAPSPKAVVSSTEP